MGFNNEKKNKNTKLKVPRRHQPHNGRRPPDIKIQQSIINLIQLSEQLYNLDKSECWKQYYHSKSIAILMKSPDNGGCYACGGLSSQTLLYTFACTGLIPISLTHWGELAATDTAIFLETEKNQTMPMDEMNNFCYVVWLVLMD